MPDGVTRRRSPVRFAVIYFARHILFGRPGSRLTPVVAHRAPSARWLLACMASDIVSQLCYGRSGQLASRIHRSNFHPSQSSLFALVLVTFSLAQRVGVARLVLVILTRARVDLARIEY